MKKDRIAHPCPPLEQYRTEISRCVKCGSCSAVCPSFLVERAESFSPRGRMALIRAILEDRLSVSDRIRDRLATCTTCLACETACASGVRVTEIIQAAKECVASETGPGIVAAAIAEMLKRPLVLRATKRLAPLALHYSRKSLRGRGNRTGAEIAGYSQSGTGAVRRAGKGGRRGSVVLFPGCAIRYFQPDIGSATAALLTRLGYEVIMPEGLKCCGRPLLSLGDRRGARDLAEHNRRILADIESDAIVTACASCGLTFKREYPTLLPPGARKPEFLDIHEFLTRELTGVRFAPTNKRITVHDPCHLGRGQGQVRAVRDLLQRVPGITIIEMNDPGRCCGFGGVMRATHRRLSDGIVEVKVRDIIATDARVVATGCPGCRMQIADALRRAEADVTVLHPVQILEEAVELGEEDT